MRSLHDELQISVGDFETGFQITMSVEEGVQLFEAIGFALQMECQIDVPMSLNLDVYNRKKQ
jgi:hypothetical protein